MAHASRIIYRESTVSKVASDIIIEKNCEKTQFQVKYLLDLLVEKKSIEKIDTEMFSLLWVQAVFYCSTMWISAFLDNKEKLKKIENKYIEVTEYLINMALTGTR